MNGKALDDDAEAVAMQELQQQIEQLDGLDRQRVACMERIQASAKDLAKARGVPFIRLESIRQELR